MNDVIQCDYQPEVGQGLLSKIHVTELKHKNVKQVIIEVNEVAGVLRLVYIDERKLVGGSVSAAKEGRWDYKFGFDHDCFSQLF